MESVTLAKYPASIRVLHWLMAIIIVTLICVGLTMEDLPKGDPLRDTLFALHKSFGVTIFLLLVLRVILRMRLGVPALPQVIPATERLFATLGHYALYLFMLIMPLSGFLMTNSFGFPVKFFGVELPKLVGTNKDMGHFYNEIHEIAGYTLIGVITLHVVAVIWHRIKGVNLLERII